MAGNRQSRRQKADIVVQECEAGGVVKVRSRGLQKGPRRSRAGFRPPCVRPSLLPAIRGLGPDLVRVRGVCPVRAGRDVRRRGACPYAGRYPSRSANRGSDVPGDQAVFSCMHTGAHTAHARDDGCARASTAACSRTVRVVLAAAAAAAPQRSCLRTAVGVLLRR